MLTPHPTHCHQQQMAQPQAAGSDSNMPVPGLPLPPQGSRWGRAGGRAGQSPDPSQVKATPRKGTPQDRVATSLNASPH